MICCSSGTKIICSTTVTQTFTLPPLDRELLSFCWKESVSAPTTMMILLSVRWSFQITWHVPCSPLSLTPGVDKLITEESLLACYPLHDGGLETGGSQRNLLYTQWASLTKFWKYQPLDAIRDYYGVKMGLYFAWLGNTEQEYYSLIVAHYIVIRFLHIYVDTP